MDLNVMFMGLGNAHDSRKRDRFFGVSLNGENLKDMECFRYLGVDME